MRLGRAALLTGLAGSAVVTPWLLCLVLGWATLRALDRIGREFGIENYIRERAAELDGGVGELRAPRGESFSADEDLEFAIEALERVYELVEAGETRNALHEIERTFDALEPSVWQRSAAA